MQNLENTEVMVMLETPAIPFWNLCSLLELGGEQSLRLCSAAPEPSEAAHVRLSKIEDYLKDNL
jgi:hypothetical protein